MKMTNGDRRRPTWLEAIKEAATQKKIALPQFEEAGMGRFLCRDSHSGRFVTLRRRLVSLAQAEKDGMEWTLWEGEEDQPNTVACFREPLHPTQDRVDSVMSILQGWMIFRWSMAEMEKFVAGNAAANLMHLPPQTNNPREYWLSSDHSFGIIVDKEQWEIRSNSQSISSWRMKTCDKRGDRLPLAMLDSLCVWLARNWAFIAFGLDVRPISVQEMNVCANRAYENALQLRDEQTSQELKSWWERHSFRSIHAESPNIFMERQADELVVSWDPSPTPTRFYVFNGGETVLPVDFAVPVLRRLIRERLKLMTLDEAKRTSLLQEISAEADGAYKLLSLSKPAIDKDWLASHGFSETEARKFAATGVSRHPIVGLLRTSQKSPMYVKDFEEVLNRLKASLADSYGMLRELSDGCNTSVDVREPWESGYRLAGLVREKLGLAPTDSIDVEVEVGKMSIDIGDVDLDDTKILGVCIGSPAYVPLILLNRKCPDANGPSGRRMTVAHEWCHLLFDRSRMHGLARFEGGGSESDRLVEMRANAFAVELLVPMSILIGEDGKVLDEDGLHAISIQRQVSMDAIKKHADNLRRRLAPY